LFRGGVHFSIKSNSNHPVGEKLLPKKRKRVPCYWEKGTRKRPAWKVKKIPKGKILRNEKKTSKEEKQPPLFEKQVTRDRAHARAPLGEKKGDG